MVKKSLTNALSKAEKKTRLDFDMKKVEKQTDSYQLFKELKKK